MRLVYYLFSRLAVWSFSKHEATGVVGSCLNMVKRRMKEPLKEPEDTVTKHGIKRVFVVLLILRILLEVGTQPAWGSAEAATMADNAQNGFSVAESAGNVVAKATKAEDAQTERSVAVNLQSLSLRGEVPRLSFHYPE